MDSRENILICLSGAPSNAKVIRTGAQLAQAFGARLSALFIEPSDFQHSDRKGHERLLENIRLAESLGAQVTTLFGEDAATQIAEYARISGATKIVLGQSPRKFGIFASADIEKRLSELAPDIDIFIIPNKPSLIRSHGMTDSLSEGFRAFDAAKTLVILALCTLTGLLFGRLGFSTANVILAYTIGVLAIAMLTDGRLYSLAASILAVLTFNFFFVSPYYSLRADPSQIATFAVMFAAAFLISSLTTRIKNHAIKAAQSAYRTEILLESSQKLQKAESDEAILVLTATQLGKLLERSVIMYPVSSGVLQAPVSFSLSGEMEESSVRRAHDAAAQLLQRGEKQESDDRREILTFPIKGTKETLFAVACILTKKWRPLANFERSLMSALLDECGIVLENAANIRAKREAEEQMRYEELRSRLLNSISHDLRTPLTGISGNAALLLGSELSEEKKQELYAQIRDDSVWLIDLVENLLSMTRMDGGKTRVKLLPELISDVFEETLAHIDPESVRHEVCIRVSDEYMMAYMDARLIVQVMINLVNNAIRYTPDGSRITVSADAEGDCVVICVADDGPGINDAAKEKIFELFYTGDNDCGDKRRGIGLGLALCRSIVSAHGSKLEVRDNAPRGAVFSFTLPIVEVNADEQSKNTCGGR